MTIINAVGAATKVCIYKELSATVVTIFLHPTRALTDKPVSEPSRLHLINQSAHSVLGGRKNKNSDNIFVTIRLGLGMLLHLFDCCGASISEEKKRKRRRIAHVRVYASDRRARWEVDDLVVALSGIKRERRRKVD